MTEVIKSFKGFTKDLQCRDFQFEIGKEYVHKGTVKACSSGFHACEYPLDVFNYYEPASSRYAEVEQSGDLSREANGDSKLASRKISIKAEIDIPYLIKAAIEYTTNKCDPVKAQHSKGDQSASSATGDQSASSATGYQSASSATGDRSASSATGYQSASSATGDQSASSATGYQSASSATGDRSASSATGDQSASSATGDQSASSVDGENSVAMNIGIYGKAKASLGGAIVLCEHDENYKLIGIKSALVGNEVGMPKPDTWYSLKNGEFVEA